MPGAADVRAILFDLDGTLTDAKPGILASYDYALARLGRQMPAGDLSWLIGPPIRECFARLLETEDAALIEEAYALYRERYDRVGKYENRVYEGIPAMLAGLLERGYTLYVATAKAGPLAASILEHFTLDRYFAGIYGAGPDGTHADKADLVRHILQVEGYAGSETILIGDRRYDIAAARANGAQAGAVTYGYGSHAELTEARPDHIFPSPRAIAAFFVTC